MRKKIVDKALQPDLAFLIAVFEPGKLMTFQFSFVVLFSESPSGLWC